MRYAIFTDIHANLEALEAVLAKIDQLNEEEPIDQLWFLGDLVGYGPNPNECIEILRARTDVIIAGNHDWAAVGKLDLEDFSEPARISAEWTAEELTEEHRDFLRKLPLRLEIGECTLVHGSPYGPLWEYLTSEALAERSFGYFDSRFCLVGHTHIPVIFQQPYTFANMPTEPFETLAEATPSENGVGTMAAVTSQKAERAQNAHVETQQAHNTREQEASTSPTPAPPERENTVEAPPQHPQEACSEDRLITQIVSDDEVKEQEIEKVDDQDQDANMEEVDQEIEEGQEDTQALIDERAEGEEDETDSKTFAAYEISDKTTPENDIQNAEGRLNDEIEELLTLLGLSHSVVQLTNEMSIPPEGLWTPAQKHRAIINPGGVGQPRDSDPRAAFMIYDSACGTFEFYRIPYALEKTQEKIILVGLPPYLAARLSYGR